MTTRLDTEILDQVLSRLDRAERRIPGRPANEHVYPVHTLRIAADRFRHDSVPRAGARGLRLLQTFAPDSVVLAQALRLPGYEALPTDPARVDSLLSRLESGDVVHPAAVLAHEVYTRVHRQLTRLPVQDVRVDFHTAFGPRSDEEEDAAAAAAATEFAITLREGMPCPRVGIRIKPLTGSEAARALRTLDLFVSTLLDRGPGFPETLVVSVPLVVHPDQVAAIVLVLGTLESRLGLVRGTLRLELGIDDPSGLFDEGGGGQLAGLISAAGGRCASIRLDPAAIARSLGSRDLTSVEPVRDQARLWLAPTGVPLSYGASPDLPHGGRRDGDRAAAVHAAWRAHADAVSRNLRQGYTWGWDHDAGQIPARLAAVTVYFRQLLPTLRTELAYALEATRWDDPPYRFALGQRLLDEVLVGLDAGALSPDDLSELGLEVEVLSTRSFRIAIERRRA
ncbi:MAG: hypothetical protein ABMA64_24680 [Myxococcota bacterium]